MPIDILDAIFDNFRRVCKCQEEMLKYWHSNGKHASWKALADALCILGHCKMSHDIERKYLSNTEGKHVSSMGIVICYLSR